MSNPHQLLAEGRTDEALAGFTTAFSEAKSEEAVYAAAMGVAICHARKRRWPAAETELAQIVERFPLATDARAYLGAVRFEQGMANEARADLDLAIQLDPLNSLSWIKRGEVLNRLGMIKEALSDFQQASRLETPDEQLRPYIRDMIIQLRRNNASTIERVPVAPRQIWNRLRGRVEKRLVPAVVASPVQLTWRER
jgi:tetratricopeptide (TPR) repeat protein